MISFNKKLLQIKLIYFFCYAGLSPLTSFGPTVAKQLGFSATSVGFVNFSSVILSIFGRIIFGYLADKFRIHKTLLILTTFLCGISVLSMAVFPKQTESVQMPSEKTYILSENDTSFVMCFANSNRTCSSWKENFDGKVCSINCYDLNLTISFANGSSSNASLSFTSCYQNQSNFSCLEAIKNGSFKILDDGTGKRKYCQISTCSIPQNSPDYEQTSTLRDFLSPLFWLYLSIFAVYFVMSFIMGVFIDTICFHILDNEEGNYGNQRMFASMGWGLAAFFSGILTDYVSENEDLKNYLPTFVVSFLLLIATAALMIFFQMPSISKAATYDWETVFRLLWNRKSVIFSCWCFVIGVCSAVVWQYSFWVVEDACNKNEHAWVKSLQGAMVMVNTFFGDVPTYYFFDRILTKLGYVHCMTVTLLLNAIRLFAYSVLNHPLWGLLIAILDGFSFGLSYATITSYANLISTPETKTIIQAFFNSVFDGLGTSLGGLYFGFIFDSHGCSWAFRSCSFLAIGAACLHNLARLRFNKKSPS